MRAYLTLSSSSRGVALLGLLLLLLDAPNALGESDRIRARKLFEKCHHLIEQDQNCDAAKACEESLELVTRASTTTLLEKAERGCRRERRTPRKACPEGMVRNKLTDNQCCWPGQVWGQPAGEPVASCVGKPTRCPEGFFADAELGICRKTCGQENEEDNGKIRTPGGGCCWPGQAWSADLQSCIGYPQCPTYYRYDAVDKKGEYTIERCIIDDSDGDGIRGEEDECPTMAEDIDLFEDEDGCPDPDNDLDGICDPRWNPRAKSNLLIPSNCQGQDACPLIPEDRDDFQDADGCPDYDHDLDLVCDPDQVQLPISMSDNYRVMSDDLPTICKPVYKDGEVREACVEGGCVPGLNLPCDDAYIASVIRRPAALCTGRDECPGVPENDNDHESEDGCPDIAPARVAQYRQYQDDLDTYATIRTWGWVALGTGVAAVTAGVVMNLVATNMRDEVNDPDRLDGTVILSVNQTDIPDIEARANTFDTIGLVSSISGGALIITGAALLIYGHLAEDEARENAPEDFDGQLQLGADVGQDHVLFMLEGRF